MITILNPGSGQFKLTLKSPLETTSWTSLAISCNLTAGQMRDQLYPFFAASIRTYSDIVVNLIKYDSAGAVTTDNTKAQKYIYTIYLLKRIKGSSFTSAKVVTYGTISSTVTVTAPYDDGGVQSSAPLAGKFTI